MIVLSKSKNPLSVSVYFISLVLVKFKLNLCLIFNNKCSLKILFISIFLLKLTKYAELNISHFRRSEKAYLRIFLRSQSHDMRNRDFRERRLAVRLCNPLSGNRDISDGKFSFVRFSFLRIIIHSFMFHLRFGIDMSVQPVQLLFSFQETRFFNKIGNKPFSYNRNNIVRRYFVSTAKYLHCIKNMEIFESWTIHVR